MRSSAVSQLARAVVCVGFDGTTIGDVPLDGLRRLGPAMLVLFARNVVDRAQTATLVSDLRTALGDPLVAVDQEGGRVARIRDGVVALPSMMALGATRDPDLAERAGARLGYDLARLGIGIDFAPALDLALEPRNTVIGTRSFGQDPEMVATLGLAFGRGLSSSGVVPVFKHFPGHGATDVDSHTALPVLNASAQQWRSRDALPFVRAIEAKVPALMTAHVVVPAFDAERPATLSPAIVEGILRCEFGYDGTVFTDCIEMDAIAKSIGSAQAAPLALAAGVDCITVSHQVELAERIVEAIENAVLDGSLSRARLERAAERAGRLREAFRPAASDAPGGADPGAEIARRAITLVRGSVALPEKGAVTVVSFEPSGTEAPSLSAHLRRRGMKAEIMRVGLDPSDEDTALLEMVLRGLSQRAIAIVMRRAHLHPRQSAAIARILDIAPDAIVVSALEPYDVVAFENAKNVVCIYDDGEPSIAALADAMAGNSPTSGILPVRLDSAAVR